MQKVYIVTTGSYSDYSIHSVFSKEEYAAKQVELMNSANTYLYEDAGYSEYILDNYKDAEVKNYWRLRFDLEKGVFLDKQVAKGKEVTNLRSTVFCYGNKLLVVTSFVAEEHAEKIAVEKYQLYLRLKNEGEENKYIQTILEM